MAEVYLNQKPVTESFSYAYVEDANGKLVRVSLASLKVLLGVGYIDGSLTVKADSWIPSDDGTYFTQEVALPNITANSKIDLDPMPEQIIQLMNEEISMFVGNAQGVTTVFAYNGAPSTDMTFSVKIREEAAV